jgi:formylglycine-generating enzyme required for sulfatase activity
MSRYDALQTKSEGAMAMTSRTRIFYSLAVTAVLSLGAGPWQSAANAFVSFDWATVGSPANTADSTSYGSVAYAYRISKHEVTNAQYAQFLNAVDPSGANSLGLYSNAMSSDARGGINFNGAATNGSKYMVKTGRANNPVVYVDFYDTLRFSNWLHNGQGSADTETGAYQLLGGTSVPTNADSVTRNPMATFFLTSEDEWYKAAYYDPTTDSYFDYATGSNTVPTSEAPAGGSNSANYLDLTTGFALTGSLTFDSNFNYLSDVGAYTSSISPFGTFDQSGNVWEWNESLIPLLSGALGRGVRGGTWGSIANTLPASHRSFSGPAVEQNNVGFRVASQIPEPATAFVLAAGCVTILGCRPRRRE